MEKEIKIASSHPKIGPKDAARENLIQIFPPSHMLRHLSIAAFHRITCAFLLKIHLKRMTSFRSQK